MKCPHANAKQAIIKDIPIKYQENLIKLLALGSGSSRLAA
jgi:hypothetical protein